MAAIVASGIGQGTGTVAFGLEASTLYVCAVGAGAVLKINGKSVKFHNTSDFYEQLDVDCTGFEVVSGSVDYVATG